MRSPPEGGGGGRSKWRNNRTGESLGKWPVWGTGLITLIYEVSTESWRCWGHSPLPLPPIHFPVPASSLVGTTINSLYRAACLVLLRAWHWFFIQSLPLSFPSPSPWGDCLLCWKIPSHHHLQSPLPPCSLQLCIHQHSFCGILHTRPQRCPDVPMRKTPSPHHPHHPSMFVTTRYGASLIAPAGTLGLTFWLQCCSDTRPGHQQPWPSSPSLPDPPSCLFRLLGLPFPSTGGSSSFRFPLSPLGCPCSAHPRRKPWTGKNSAMCYGRRNMDFGIRPGLGKVLDLWAVMVGPQLWWGWWTWWMWLCLALRGCLVKGQFLLSLYPLGCWGLTNQKWTNILSLAPTHSTSTAGNNSRTSQMPFQNFWLMMLNIV